MPQLKTRMIFISHAWEHNAVYWTLVGWLNDAPNFVWKNCSVPNHAGLPDTTAKGLAEGITRQINPAQCVVILGGMYAAHSGWIDYEIDEAVRLRKPILAVVPFGQQRVPMKLREHASREVGWRQHSVVEAIRQLT